jgi:hypothetical protein
MDAGSSGTRIYVFAWPLRESPDSFPPAPGVAQIDTFLNAQDPGISSFSAHPQDVGTVLTPLLQVNACVNNNPLL